MPAVHAIRRLAPLWVFFFLFKIAAALHYTLMPAYGERVLPVAAVGLLVGAAAFLQLCCDVPGGMLIDRFGYRRFLGVTTICFLAATIVLFFGLTMLTFLATLTVSVFGWLFLEPSVNAYLLAETPHASAGRVMSFRDVCDSAGIAVAAGTFTFFIDVPVPVTALILVLVFVASGIALTFVRRDRSSVHAVERLPAHHFRIRRTAVRDALRALQRLNPASAMLLVTGFAASSFYGIIWFVVPILATRSTESGIPGIGLGIFDLTIAGLGYFIGRLADRSDHRRLVFLGLLLFAGAGAFLGFSAGIWFLLLGFLATTGDEMASISLWTWLHELDHWHTEDATVAAAIAMMQDLGWTVGPILAGFAFVPLGASWTIALGAGIVFLAWLACVLILGPRRALALAPLSRPVVGRLPRHRHKH